MAIQFTIIQKAHEKCPADGQPNNTIVIRAGSASTVERDPGEHVAKAYSKVMSSEKVGGIKTLSYPWGAHTRSRTSAQKAALNSGVRDWQKSLEKTAVFLKKLASSPHLIKLSEEV